jgi:glutathione S-transferase
MQYLADKKGNTDLFPKDFSIRSDISRWQFWSLATFERASGAALWENGLKKFLGAGEPDPSLVKASEEDFLAALKVLNDHLANRNYLVTDNITLADYAFSGTMMFAEDAKYPLADFPHVQKWWARIQSQDGWKKSGEHVMTPKQLMARK